MKNGLLLINLGTPDNPDTSAVRRYLREFLADRRVINLPAPLRYLILYGFILPFRPKKSAHAYQAIWTQHGSPLLCNSQNLCQKLQDKIGDDYKVVLGMRYGNPSIQAALNQLRTCEHITILPLYPQYSSAATGSSIEKVLPLLENKTIFPSVTIIRDFYQHPSFIDAQAKQIKPYIVDADYVLFSYHGLPENHLHQVGCKPICANECPLPTRNGCYRAQCFETTNLIADAVKLPKTQYATVFQSRLGKTEWIKPYTDTMLSELAAKGIKRLAITCPSFVADCLETLEEIGIRAKEQWLQLGGEQLTLIPSMNDDPNWVEAILRIVRNTAGTSS